MTGTVPFHLRNLASFEDDIITRQIRGADGRWLAVLDCGFEDRDTDPDFSSQGAGLTREDAARSCARAIRLEAGGALREFNPSRVFLGDEFRFRLMKHWSKKERYRRVGVDPNEAVSRIRALDSNDWKLKGPWIWAWSCAKSLEFDFRLFLSEMAHSVVHEGVQERFARSSALRALESSLDELDALDSTTHSTWEMISNRLDNQMEAIAAARGARHSRTLPSIAEVVFSDFGGTMQEATFVEPSQAPAW